MKKLLVILAILSSFFLLPQNIFAADPIRITGFDYPRNEYPFYNPYVQFGDEEPTAIVAALNDPNNFGAGGIVPCNISWQPFVNEIAPGSLVQNGQRTADVFMAGEISTNLSSTETSELRDFLLAGGIVYVSGAEETPATASNKFFESLGIEDRFSSDFDQTYDLGLSFLPEQTPITNGPFGSVGKVSHYRFRILNSSSLDPVIRGFESGESGPIVTFGLQLNEGSTTSDNYLLFEKS